MERQEVLERLNAHLARVAQVTAAPDPQTDIVTGLGLDSFKVLDLIMEIEDEFDISVPVNLLADVRTIDDLAGLLHNRIEDRR